MDDIKLLIIEDDFLQAEELKHKLAEEHYKIAGIRESKPAALKAVAELRPDLVLVDLELRGAPSNIDGIALGKEIKAKYSIPVIFMSSYVNLLVHEELVDEKLVKKPILDYEELSIFIQQAIKGKKTFLSSIFQDSFFIKAGSRNETIRIVYDNILYIKAEGAITSFYLEDGSKYSLSTTLGTIMKQIEHEFIVRVHNSYAINMKKINGYTNDSFLIAQENIPVGSRLFNFNNFRANINYVYTSLSYK